METDFSGKAVMVTGASRGIGREIARQFAERGARVVLHYHENREAAEQTLTVLAGHSHFMVQADLSEAASIGPMAQKAVNEMGRIDVLVNNAGIYEFHPVAKTSFKDWQHGWEKTIFTNLMGPAHLSFHLARHMMANGGGKIINITSRGAFRGEPDAPAYGAAKAGLNSFSQSMAQALAPHNIFMYAVAPGFVETDRSRPGGFVSGGRRHRLSHGRHHRRQRRLLFADLKPRKRYYISLPFEAKSVTPGKLG